MFRNYNNYEVFEDGRIWSKVRKKWLKPKTEKNGYQRVCLYDDEGKKHFELLHKVVYFAVNSLLEYPEGHEINHLDENKENNQISNLSLVSRKENANWGTRNERVSKAQSKRVGAFKDGVLIMIFASTNEAGRQGFSQGNISECCRNCYLREGNNKYKGYEWRYLDE